MKTNGGYAQRALRVVLVVICLAFIARARSPQAAPRRGALSAVATTKSRIVDGAYGKLPLSFEPNVGQSDPRVQFLSNGGTYQLFLTKHVAILELAHSMTPNATINRSPRPDRNSLSHRAVSVLDLSFVDGNPFSAISGLGQLPGRTDYFIGKDPKDWRTGVPSFRRVEYREVYPGIDVVFYGNQRQLEFDCVLAPRADSSRIALRIGGASHLRIDGGGNLRLRIGGKWIEVRRPTIYQQAKEGRTQVTGHYVIDADNIVRFRIGVYDHSRSLVVDPVLVYATYLGGSSDGWPGSGIAVDSQGDAFVGGGTLATDFPTTSSAMLPSAPSGISTSYNGESAGAGFVTEINPSGTAVLYSTYLGGNGGDGVYDLALDSANPPNVYVTGFTCSTNFPTTQNAYLGAFAPVPCNWNSQTGFSGGAAFVTKFNPSVSGTAALQYSTYLGGNGGEFSNGVAIDAAGNIYVTGQTFSSNFPVTSSAFQSTNKAASLGTSFVTRIDPTESGAASLVYSTYLGGSGNATYQEGDEGDAIGVDSAGNAYIVGDTLSTDFPTTSSAFMLTAPKSVSAPDDSTGPVGGGFVARVNTNESGTASLVYSTFLGGSCTDLPYYGQILGPNNRVYAPMYTCSSDFPVTTGAYQTSPPASISNGTAALSVIDTSQSGTGSLVYSTFLGGSGFEIPETVTVDSVGDAYIGGVTGSPDFPITSNALQNSWSGCASGFFSELAPRGNGSADLVYSTFLSGTENSSEFCSDYWPGVYDIALDGAGDAYLAGLTGATNFPVTANAFETSLTSDAKTYVAKLDMAPSIASLSANSGTVGTSVTIAGTNFGSTEGFSTVTFNGTPATPTGWSDTSIVVPVPSGAATGNVIVTVGGVASNGVTFTVLSTTGPSYVTGDANACTATSCAASMTGTNAGDLIVLGLFVGNSTSVSSVTDTQGNTYTLIDSSPWSSHNYVERLYYAKNIQGGADTITVALSGSEYMELHAYDYSGLDPSSPLDVSATPQTGTSVTTGTSGTLTTTNANDLLFAFFHSDNDVTNTAGAGFIGRTPPGDSCPLGEDRDVTSTGSYSATMSFSGTADYVAFFVAFKAISIGGGGSGPSITNLSPTSGPVGTSVTISGSNFGSAPGSSTVTFSGTTAAPTSWSATSIVAPVPDGASTGNVVVTVDGVDSNGLNFTVTSAPTISSLSPNSGPVGTTVTITGTSFGSTQGSSMVTFDGTLASPTSWSNTGVVVPVPSGASTGNVVVTVAGVASNGLMFMVATTGPTVYYYVEDELGSTRTMVQDGQTSPCYDADFYPFGGERVVTDTCSQNYKFTGKERDTESGNDYFGARYYGSSMGRFLSPDPVFISAQRLMDPQGLNLYSYVRNNPLGLTDDSGLDFYLACQTSDHSGCGQVQNGDQSVWVQGQGTGKDFQAYDIDMNRDGSGLFSDQFGNDYTGTFNQNGVSFSSVDSGGASGSGRFIDGSDQTDVNGSGLFSGLQGHFVSDCGGSCEARGSLTGSAQAFATMEGQLNRQSGAMSALDLLSGAHNSGIQWKDSNGFIHVIQNGQGTLNAGVTEMHFEGHPTGVDVTQFVLHMVDTIRDATNGDAAAEKNRVLPTGPAQ
jgi:RHS repeat-associated protein